MKTEENRSSKRCVITIDDDDSPSQQPANKKRATESSPEVMQKSIVELEQKLAKSERNFQAACGKIRETEDRVRFLENLIDTNKPQVVDGAMKRKEEEWEKKVKDLTNQLEQERKGAAEKKQREDELEKKISELAASLTQVDGLQEASHMLQSLQSLFGTQKTQQSAVTEDAEVAQLKRKLEENIREYDRYKNAHLACEADTKELLANIENLKVAHQKSETEKKELITKMEYEDKLKAKDIENLKNAHLACEAEKQELLAKMEYEVKLKDMEIENLKIGYEKSKAETESVITKMECEAKLKGAEIENFKKMECEFKSRISQLETVVEAVKNGDNLKSTEMTIRLRFTEISKLTEKYVYSKPTTLAGIDWRVFTYKNHGVIGFYLQSKKFGESKWSCSALSEFQLFSQQDNTILIRASNKPHLFNESSHYECVRLIDFKELFKISAVRDDSIIIAIIVKVFPSI